MPALTGYVDRWSVKPGGTIRFMVSSADGHDFALRFVRHVCADPNPAGPGYAEISMASPFDAMQPGKAQPAYLGNFGHVASLPADLQTGVSLSATIWPTTPGKGRQGLVALRINVRGRMPWIHRGRVRRGLILSRRVRYQIDEFAAGGKIPRVQFIDRISDAIPRIVAAVRVAGI